MSHHRSDAQAPPPRSRQGVWCGKAGRRQEGGPVWSHVARRQAGGDAASASQRARPNLLLGGIVVAVEKSPWQSCAWAGPRSCEQRLLGHQRFRRTFAAQARTGDVAIRDPNSRSARGGSIAEAVGNGRRFVGERGWRRAARGSRSRQPLHGSYATRRPAAVGRRPSQGDRDERAAVERTRVLPLGTARRARPRVVEGRTQRPRRPRPPKARRDDRERTRGRRRGTDAYQRPLRPPVSELVQSVCVAEAARTPGAANWPRGGAQPLQVLAKGRVRGRTAPHETGFWSV